MGVMMVGPRNLTAPWGCSQCLIHLMQQAGHRLLMQGSARQYVPGRLQVLQQARHVVSY
jgi:hypothetical protein